MECCFNIHEGARSAPLTRAEIIFPVQNITLFKELLVNQVYGIFFVDPKCRRFRWKGRRLKNHFIKMPISV